MRHGNNRALPAHSGPPGTLPVVLSKCPYITNTAPGAPHLDSEMWDTIRAGLIHSPSSCAFSSSTKKSGVILTVAVFQAQGRTCFCFCLSPIQHKHRVLHPRDVF